MSSADLRLQRRKRNLRTPGADRGSDGVEDDLKDHLDEKQHKIESWLNRELHGLATPAKPQAAAGLRALEEMYRGVGAAAGREDASLHLEEKKQQGTQPQRVEPSSEAAKRLKSIESMYNGGTPARPFGESHFFAVERVAPRT